MEHIGRTDGEIVIEGYDSKGVMLGVYTVSVVGNVTKEMVLYLPNEKAIAISKAIKRTINDLKNVGG